jgi:hypothetical protein
MKFRLVYTVFLGALCAVVLLGNKNGRASQAQKGNTGAPGDETQGGQPKTCVSCHNQGPITASAAISVLDANNTPVAQYTPGQQYTARVTITASGPNLGGYGFQMIALRASDNSDLDGFSDTNPNNYKLATIPGGRTYAEHDNISTPNTFDVRWTAPAAGTGTVKFYASGNGVNKNGQTSGDGAGAATLTLTESGATSATDNLLDFSAKAAVTPNPARAESRFRAQVPTSGDYRLEAFDLSGRLVWSSAQQVQDSDLNIEISMADWAPGIYLLCASGAEAKAIVKVLKL